MDAEGVQALTMERLGAAFGVRGMALYRYFPNKDSILDAVTTRLFEQIEPPVGDVSDAFSHLRSIMLSFYQVVEAHPSFRHLLVRGANLPASVALHRHGVGLLERAGFDSEAAPQALGSLVAYVVGSIQQTKYPARKDPFATFVFGLDAMLDGLRTRGRGH